MRSEEFNELFTKGKRVWLSDEITSSILSNRRISAGVEVRALLNISFGRGENIINKNDVNQIPAKTAAAFDQANALLKPIFFSTRSLKPY